MENKDFEEIVKEKLNCLYKEETEENSTEENSSEEKSNDETTKDETTKDETFSATDFNDFLKQTNTKVEIKKEGCMPSPIFGSRDLNNHNKYRVHLSNINGKISFIFWDSIMNTENNKPLNKDNALCAFGLDISAYESTQTLEDFKDSFGYTDVDNSLAEKAFRGCQKQYEKAKKIFTEEQLEELKRIASEM